MYKEHRRNLTKGDGFFTCNAKPLSLHIDSQRFSLAILQVFAASMSVICIWFFLSAFSFSFFDFSTVCLTGKPTFRNHQAVKILHHHNLNCILLSCLFFGWRLLLFQSPGYIRKLNFWFSLNESQSLYPPTSIQLTNRSGIVFFPQYSWYKLYCVYINMHRYSRKFVCVEEAYPELLGVGL